jgi:hypothetical protein
MMLFHFTDSSFTTGAVKCKTDAKCERAASIVRHELLQTYLKQLLANNSPLNLTVKYGLLGGWVFQM